MTYPKGEMRQVWDGRGTRGPSADCVVTPSDIQLRPKKAIKAFLGWPELVLPRNDIRGVEEGFLGRYRFRLDNAVLDGACFRPIGSKHAFLTALDQLKIPIIQISWTAKLALELMTFWNQVRWGGRLRQPRWKRKWRERP